MQNITTELEYWFWLCNIDGMGSRKLQELLKYYKEPEQIYRMKAEEIGKVVSLSERQLAGIQKSKTEDNWKRKLEQAVKKGVCLTRYRDPNYPKALLLLPDKPILLYSLGKLPDEKKKRAAVVGARNCTEYGYHIAKEIGKILGGNGIDIISGMARGIDAAGQWGSLEGGGESYGILGCGVDICYPRENQRLYRELIDRGGVISEFGPSVQPYACNFPMRNRIISGLSDWVIVVEARERSGSFITVDFALEQGKEVYAVPGRITDSLSCGCNRLIAQGAGILSDFESILESFHIKNGTKVTKSEIELAEQEKLLYSDLGFEPKNIQTLMEDTKWSFSKLAEVLLNLQLKNLVEEPMKGYYVKKE
ncbi:MAG: DNA-processing protein DprA [Lachnospiraceae bacterium]|nr:DNA-processing protein DprA [Lachnospiraceae bacterium]